LLKLRLRKKVVIVELIILIIFSPFLLNLFLTGLSNYNLNKGKYEKSEKILSKLIYIDKYIYGENSNTYLKIREKLSDIYFLYGDYNKALKILNDNYQIRKNNKKNNNLINYFNGEYFFEGFIVLYNINGDYNKALKILNNNYQTRKNNKKLINYFDGCYLLIRLAGLNGIKGDYAQAEKFLKEAINIDLKLYGINSTLTIYDKLSLIQLYLKENNIKKAKYELNKFNFNTEKYLNPNEYYFNWYIFTLGEYYLKSGQKDKAIKLYFDTLKIIDNSYPKYVRKDEILRNLGRFYYYIGDYQKAEKTFNEMIDLQIHKFGKDSYKIADSYMKLAFVNLKLNKIQEALNLVEKALIIRKKHYSPIHPKLYCGIYYKESILRLKNKDNSISLKYPANSSIIFIKSYKNKNTQNIKDICNFVEMENY
jgi:tetratricopeptide (TPR) repeat protein